MTELHKNENYTVSVAELEIEGGEKRTGYQIINNETGVIEFQGFCLPQNLQLAEEWNSKLIMKFHEHFKVPEEKRVQAADASQLDLLPEPPTK